MDKEEARAVALARVHELRRLPYEDLKRRFLDRPAIDEAAGPLGATYHLETLAFGTMLTPARFVCGST